MPGKNRVKLGWLGTGRMGFEMAKRLAVSGHDLAVYNRRREKAEPLAEYGASIVDTPRELADRDIIFTILSTGDVLSSVLLDPNGIFADPAQCPKICVDCTSISQEDSAAIRDALQQKGVSYIAAPVSGNGKVVKAGQLSLVASGPEDAYHKVLPYLQALGKGVSYVGEGDLSRIVKTCHNVLLGVVAQCLSEITVLAEKAGVPRHAFLDFINNSVMGSVFSRYKSPAMVHLNFATTFTPTLLRKDLDIGLSTGRRLEVPMPLAATTRDIVQTLINHGYRDTDFITLLELQAQASAVQLEPENVEMQDGLNNTYPAPGKGKA